MSNPPDYDDIAARIHARNCTPASIATALRAAYAKGRGDAKAAGEALSPDDVDAVVRIRLERHVARTEALAAKVDALVAELKRVDGS